MNYQDMLRLKKGDCIRAFVNGEWISGEIVGSDGGGDPGVWLMQKDGTSLKVHTGSNFVESTWYKFNLDSKFAFEGSNSEQITLDDIRVQRNY